MTTQSDTTGQIHRRAFLKTAAAVVAGTALLRAQQSNPTTKSHTMEIQITRTGSKPSVKGPADWFTGTTRIDPLFDPTESARAGAAHVTFEPGARTAWHTHPLGQRLIVTSGLGWVQGEGSPVQEIRPGDVVWFPPGLRHWHGATPTTAMTHIAIQEQLNGKVVDWMEKVTDEQYRR
ncbi:MAG: cupin domain-containing protein [Opitutaceae bacterium]|nr:cupin domain-containing protein [Opitutaceae bacterium]